jgi:TolB-like protein/Tfp pilus assembly protein PilF
MKTADGSSCTGINTAWDSLDSDDRSKGDEIPETLIREQLSRILQSSTFVQSNRLGRFLRFVVGKTLSGEASVLKEYVIGMEVYDRKPPYHPSLDSIVRTEARRLRSKLKEYYESDGEADPVFLYFRKGSYVPVFRLREKLVVDSPQEVVPEEHPAENIGTLTIAVIPFVDLTGDPLSTECARGITEELSHELMRTDSCRVAAISLAAPYTPGDPDIPFLAQKLGVQFAFEGTVRKETSRLRTTARLVDRDGFQLWSQRFDIESDGLDLFKITEQIASALVSRIRPKEANRQWAHHLLPSNCPSVLSAEALLDEGAETGNALARFQEIVAAKPRNARAHCGVGQCHYEIALSGNAGSVDAVFSAKRAMLQALELDSKMIAAHAFLGSVLALELNWGAAEKSFEYALILGTDAVSYRQYALFLTAMARFDEAWHYLQRSEQIDPFSHRQKLACMKFFYFSRRYEEALEYFTGPLSYGSLPLESQVYLSFTYLQIGRQDDARAMANNVLRDSVRLPSLMTHVAEILALCGDTAGATQIADKYKLRSHASPISKFRQFSLEIALGDLQSAAALLAEACHRREPELFWMGVDARFDGIRNMGQFARANKNCGIRL